MRGKDCRFRTGGTLAYQKAIAGPPCADGHGPACATSRNTPKGLGNPAPLRYRTGFAAIAQLVEHVIRNDGVGGSIPSCGSSRLSNPTFAFQRWSREPQVSWGFASLA